MNPGGGPGLGTLQGQDRPPNVILILADDMGFGDVGAYNGGLSSTPAIDSLIDEGISLAQHYAGSPVCACAKMCASRAGVTQLAECLLPKPGPPRATAPLVADPLSSPSYALSLVATARAWARLCTSWQPRETLPLPRQAPHAECHDKCAARNTVVIPAHFFRDRTPCAGPIGRHADSAPRRPVASDPLFHPQAARGRPTHRATRG